MEILRKNERRYISVKNESFLNGYDINMFINNSKAFIEICFGSDEYAEHFIKNFLELNKIHKCCK